jgi:hypothetical protein
MLPTRSLPISMLLAAVLGAIPLARVVGQAVAAPLAAATGGPRLAAPLATLDSVPSAPRSEPSAVTVPAAVRAAGGARGKHILIGALIGGVLATTVAVVSVKTCDDRGGEGPPCALGWTGVPLAGVAGVLVGGAIGAALPARPASDTTNASAR